ncbi:hypothetical protein FRB99_006499 [Tulasnella sp. 403]|nr:hypothetical protein FRB99_006499 [Tulasnella sp. 403]
MSTTPPSIALIGAHTTEFSSQLEKAGSRIVTYGSAAELKAASATHDAIALDGEDHGLVDPTHIASLLDAGSVLISSSPGAEFLETLHRVTNTPIDLPAFRPTKERPLMVYKVQEMVHVITPPRSKTNREITGKKVGPDGRISDLPQHAYTVKTPPVDGAYIVQRVRAARERITSPQMKAVATNAGEVYNLDPGNDVAFFKKGVWHRSESAAIDTLAWTRDGHIQKRTSDPNEQQTYNTDWAMAIYAYATDFDPRGQTGDTYDGTIYTYIVHDGQHQRAGDGPVRWCGPNTAAPGSSECAFYFADQIKYSFSDPSGLMTKLTHQPDDNVYEHTKNTFTYNISQSQTMTLFRANKKQTWQFKAQYDKPVAWTSFQLHRDMLNQSDMGFFISYNDYYDIYSDPEFQTDKWWNPGVFDLGKNPHAVRVLPKDNVPIAGLTVFRSTVGKPRVKSELEFVPRAYKSDAWRTDSDESKFTHPYISTTPQAMQSVDTAETLDPEVAATLRSLDSLGDTTEELSQADIDEGIRATQELKAWQDKSLRDLQDLQTTLLSEPDKGWTCQELADFIKRSAPFDGDDGFIVQQTRAVAKECLESIRSMIDNEATRSPRFLREVISTVLTSHLKPLFLANPHPRVNLDSGRKLYEHDGSRPSYQDYLDDQKWKTDGKGCWNTLAWCVTQLQVDDFEALWPMLIPPMMTIMDDHDAGFRIRGIRIAKELIRKVDPRLLKRTGIDSLLSSLIVIVNLPDVFQRIPNSGHYPARLLLSSFAYRAYYYPG